MTGELMMAITLLVVGVGLTLVEVAIIPGFGFAGLLALASFGAGSWMVWTAAGPAMGSLAILGSLVGSALALRIFLRSRRGERLVLRAEISGTAVGVEAMEAARGREAVVIAALRPSGVVELDGDRLDAVLKDGTFLEVGRRVRLVGTEHGQAVVLPVEDAAEPPA